jgi:hypothetical protein
VAVLDLQENNGYFMENNIIIKKDLKFDYMDLMSNVDPSSTFTLEDIFAICENSKIPMDILCKILKCRHIPEIIEESKLIKEKEILLEKLNKNISFKIHFSPNLI